MKSSRRVSTVPSSSTMVLRFRAICRTSRMGLWVSHRMAESSAAETPDGEGEAAPETSPEAGDAAQTAPSEQKEAQ